VLAEKGAEAERQVERTEAEQTGQDEHANDDERHDGYGARDDTHVPSYKDGYRNKDTYKTVSCSHVRSHSGVIL